MFKREPVSELSEGPGVSLGLLTPSSTCSHPEWLSHSIRAPGKFLSARWPQKLGTNYRKGNLPATHHTVARTSPQQQREPRPFSGTLYPNNCYWKRLGMSKVWQVSWLPALPQFSVCDTSEWAAPPTMRCFKAGVGNIQPMGHISIACKIIQSDLVKATASTNWNSVSLQQANF